MEEKQIEITTEIAVYHIPLRIVASDRAEYYKIKGEDYQTEYDFVMTDDYEGIDWIKNNMNYSDYKQFLVLVKKLDDVEDFPNAEMEIV